jgi:A/G-specific adenine glycosylase
MTDRARHEPTHACGAHDFAAPSLAQTIGDWYDDAARDLPWRRTRDPYAIWVSEVMLQQTRVETVVPYYRRFLAEFPTVRALAVAPLANVLLRWSGLGYYRRARQLHLAASEVVERYGGVLPTTEAELRSLAGIGEYTAGAIASIAFDRPAAVVDGNVARVLCRVFSLADDLRSARGKERVWSLARALVPHDRPGRFNQALMELGATLCTPRAPSCPRCPVKDQCQANREGKVAELPRVSKRRTPRVERLVAAVVTSGARVLLAQRRKEERFGGMWEPPLALGESLHDTRAALLALGVPSDVELASCEGVRHVLSHRRLEVAVVAATSKGSGRLPQPTGSYCELAWRRPDSVALSTLARKILAAAGALMLALVTGARPAHAAGDSDATAALDPSELEIYEAQSQPRGRYARVMGTVSFGRGVRFNNPYRLRTQTGSSAEGLSFTAPYIDLGFALGFGDPAGLQHGPNLHASFATEGVSQPALGISYMLLYRARAPVMGYGRGGVSILTAPDPNTGGELALGFAAFATGSIGAVAELAFDLYYGAGTYEKKYTVVPVSSLQLGLIVDFEVLP